MSTNDDRSCYLSPADIARVLAVDRQTAWRLARRMGCTHVGRLLRVSREHFEAWVAAHTDAPSEPAGACGRNVKGKAALVLADAASARHVAAGAT